MGLPVGFASTTLLGPVGGTFGVVCVLSKVSRQGILGSLHIAVDRGIGFVRSGHGW